MFSVETESFFFPMMDMSNKHMRPTGCKDIVGDRISSLPDVLLHHILSFTTAREAVQTCVLSTRWRHTWQSLRCLTIAVREFTSRKGFVKFMDNILLRRGCVPLGSFHLMGWKWNGGVSLNHPRANLWVCHALRSNVRVLGITEYSWFFNLDHYSFTSSHLKTLNLNCVSVSCLFIEKLFSGCPALEDLAMVDCRAVPTKFSSSTLKNLILISIRPSEDDVPNDFKYVIDTPSLVSLHLEDVPFFAPYFVNVSSLVTASISLEPCFSSSYAACNILSALSQVTDLKLLSPKSDNGTFGLKVNKVLRRDLLRCETFINLKILSVGEWCADANFGTLIRFLRCTPILEKLTVHLSMIGASVCDGQKDNPLAKETRKLFNCECLKKVKITCPQGDKRVYDIMKIIIANASSLPKIVIDPFEY